MASLTRARCELRTQVDAVLRSLGDDPAHVARHLEAAGVRGRPRNPEGCAIAVYLSAVVGSDPRVRAVLVMPERVVVQRARWWQAPVMVPLPKALCGFVAQFDHHRYPRLIRARTEATRPGRSTGTSARTTTT